MSFDPKTYIEKIHADGQEEKSPFRRCGHAGCTGEGSYKAPKGRKNPGEYYWFCLDHVRSYNKQWNFFTGMSRVDMENWRRRDRFGHRPLWPLGGTRGGHDYDEIPDPFVFFGDDGAHSDRPDFQPQTRKEDDMLGWSLETFGLRRVSGKESLKARYLTLVKRYHPDVTGGNKVAEERLKLINEAYQFLKRRWDVLNADLSD